MGRLAGAHLLLAAVALCLSTAGALPLAVGHAAAARRRGGTAARLLLRSRTAAPTALAGQDIGGAAAVAASSSGGGRTSGAGASRSAAQATPAWHPAVARAAAVAVRAAEAAAAAAAPPNQRTLLISFPTAVDECVLRGDVPPYSLSTSRFFLDFAALPGGPPLAANALAESAAFQRFFDLQRGVENDTQLFNTFLDPPVHNVSAGASTHVTLRATNAAGKACAYTLHFVLQATQDSLEHAALAQAAAHFTGFDGQAMGFQAAAGAVYNLLSDPAHQLNAQFGSAAARHNAGNASLLRAAGLKHSSDRIKVHLDEALGGLLVEANGKPLAPGAQHLLPGGATHVALAAPEADRGQELVVTTPAFRFRFAAPARPEGPAPWAARLEVAVEALVKKHNAHGALGRTLAGGTEEDLVEEFLVDSLFGDDFPHNRFTGAAAAPGGLAGTGTARSLVEFQAAAAAACASVGVRSLCA